MYHEVCSRKMDMRHPDGGSLQPTSAAARQHAQQAIISDHAFQTLQPIARIFSLFDQLFLKFVPCRLALPSHRNGDHCRCFALRPASPGAGPGVPS
jgi:hypothetical protein